MAREIPESEVATMEALVKCGVVMVSIALAYPPSTAVKTPRHDDPQRRA
jgi:hypothetical protein